MVAASGTALAAQQPACNDGSGIRCPAFAGTAPVCTPSGRRYGARHSHAAGQTAFGQNRFRDVIEQLSARMGIRVNEQQPIAGRGSRAAIARAQVESAPAVIKKGLKKEEAEALLAKLKEAGAKAALA